MKFIKHNSEKNRLRNAEVTHNRMCALWDRLPRDPRVLLYGPYYYERVREYQRRVNKP
jgi:hypothetical protein